MDTLTHALSGALLARTVTPREAPELRSRMRAGFVSAAFPDSDFALRAVDTLVFLNHHQGLTHSLVALPLWALGLALCFGRLYRRRWQAFYGVCALGIAAHIAGDVLTAYGTQVFAPLSDWRASLPLVFVLDPWFSGIVAAALLAGALRPALGRVAAVAGWVALAGYVGLLGALQQKAEAAGLAHARELGLAEAHALPQPLSPFHWKVLVAEKDAFREAWLDLLPGPDLLHGTLGDSWLGRVAGGYRPEPAWQRHPRFGSGGGSALARQAWQDPALAAFRRFARFPVLHRVERDEAQLCVWFADLRFTLPGLPPSFVFGACRQGTQGEWRLARLRGSFWID